MNFIKNVSVDEYNELNKKYIALKEAYDEIAKAFDATEHCCPYDNEKCSKTGCYVIGGFCARRSKEVRE